MKKIYSIILLLAVCFSCQKETSIVLNTMMENNSRLLAIGREDTLLGKFICIKNGFRESGQRELNQMEKNAFSQMGSFVFHNGSIYTYLLHKEIDVCISIATDTKLGMDGEMKDKGAYYDVATSIIFFRQNDIPAVDIQEEFLHYVQHRVFNYKMYKSYECCIDFEVAMVIDIINAIETRQLPSVLYVKLSEGMNDYKSMIESFATRSYWRLDEIHEKFNEWIKAWEFADPTGENHPLHLLGWVYKVAIGMIDIRIIE